MTCQPARLGAQTLVGSAENGELQPMVGLTLAHSSYPRSVHRRKATPIMVRRSAVLLAALAPIVGVAAPAAHAAAAPSKLTIHFTKTPARLTNQATPTFSLVRNVHFGVRSQTCRIDTAAWKACSLSWKPGHLKDGRHTAQAKLVMTDHRVATAGYTWTIDTAAPAPPRLAGLIAGWSNAPETVTATASDTTGGSGVNHLEYRIANGAGGPYTAAQTARQVTISGEGVTQVQFRRRR